MAAVSKIRPRNIFDVIFWQRSDKWINTDLIKVLMCFESSPQKISTQGSLIMAFWRNNLRLRRVERIRTVSNVLGAVKDPESQPSQKVSWREVSCHRPDLKTRFLLQIIVHVLQLWDIVLPRENKSTIFEGVIWMVDLAFTLHSCILPPSPAPSSSCWTLRWRTCGRVWSRIGRLSSRSRSPPGNTSPEECPRPCNYFQYFFNLGLPE